MDRHRELALIRARLPLLIAVVVLAGIGAFLFSGVQSKVYEARASLIVGTSINQLNPDPTGILASQQLAATYATIATTRPVLDAVIAKLGLPMNAGELLKNITASTGTDSTFLTITVRDGDANRAKDIANTLADQLIAVSPALSGPNVQIRKSVDAYLKATEEQITVAQAQAVTLSGTQNRTPAQDAALAALETQLVNLRATYASLLAFSSAGSASLLSVIEPAVAPDTPISPRPLLNVLLACVIALLVAGAVILLAAYLDDTIKTPADVEEVVGLPTLGSVARMTGGRGRSESTASPPCSTPVPRSPSRTGCCARTSSSHGSTGRSTRSLSRARSRERARPSPRRTSRSRSRSRDGASSSSTRTCVSPRCTRSSMSRTPRA